uniref:uncharacterized protein LOC120332931 n=1 Tax=Styela clava TaxID=7725 RepID=UPI00193A3402|nr:uncharacterized protein LOC120332931 [Styela clava]
MLMRNRKPDWTWENLTTPIILQLTAQKTFFGRGKTANALVKNIKSKFKEMTMRQKAEHIISAKSMCLDVRSIDGVDFAGNVSDEIKMQFPDDARFPTVGYDMLSIGIGSVCISGIPFEGWFVDRLIEGQNKNGSFGDSEFLQNTIKLLPALHCLFTMPNSTINKTKLNETISAMRNFVIENLSKMKDGEIVIENKPMTSLALIGLWKTKREGDDPETWSCRYVSNEKKSMLCLF